jgi:predicted dienelactone hydrolase
VASQCKFCAVVVVLLGLLLRTQESAAQETQEPSAGYAVMRITDDARHRPIHLDIWYPTTAQTEQSQNYGFSVGHAARGARLTGDHLPVVLLSHGAFGAASNYSWLAEHLARRGNVVLGVSHFGESPVFGRDSIRPASATKFVDRTKDLTFALVFLLQRSAYSKQLDPNRVAIVGHSSAGASALMLAGAVFSPRDLAAYCRSVANGVDKGCQYSSAAAAESLESPVALDLRPRALVALDPAVGPGFTDASLRALHVPVLVVGSVENDFLPYGSHAERVSGLLPEATLTMLDHGEGHFIYLDECTSPLEIHGVKLCSDRQGVDRRKVHESLKEVIAEFLDEHFKMDLNRQRISGLPGSIPLREHGLLL